MIILVYLPNKISGNFRMYHTKKLTFVNRNMLTTTCIKVASEIPTKVMEGTEPPEASRTCTIFPKRINVYCHSEISSLFVSFFNRINSDVSVNFQFLEFNRGNTRTPIMKDLRKS